jgi:hypothetical protein
MIGVSPDELIELRSKGEIFGYRDGASWKFKLEEVERVTADRAGGPRRGSDSSVMSADDEEFITGLSSKILAEKAQEESGSILVSEEELGISATGSSTIIGKGKTKPSDSDIQLASNIVPGSDKLLEAPGSRLQLGADAGDVLSGSDIKIKGGSGTGDMPAMPKPGSSGGGLDLGPTLSLDEREESDSDSALDEVKLDRGPGGTGSGKGSDVTLGAGDSGINLKPADSGLSLEEEPLELGGGSGVDSLELPEDEEVISLDAEAADPDQATQLKADNEFLLAPGDKAEDESDSGSQVIALEDSEAFDQDAATMLGAQQAAAPVLTADAFQPIGADLGAPAAVGMAAGQPVYVQVPAQEMPYSVWNVLSLGTVALLLALGGMLMTDVMLNMWSFGGTTSASTQVMDFFIKTFNLDA